MTEETRSEEVSKAKETVKRGAKSGAFAAASGSITLVRGLNALRKREGKRAAVRLLAAGLWFGVAAAQRRMGEGGSGFPLGDDEIDQRSVADTSPDISDVATDADEGTGPESPGDPSDVVSTMSADLDEHDTATEHDADVDTDPSDAVNTTTADIDESDTATELDSDVDSDDVDQSDVVDTSIDPEVAEEAQEPASTDNAQVVEEEGETEVDTGRDEDDEDENEVEPDSLDGDAEPAITESDGSGDDADDGQDEDEE